MKPLPARLKSSAIETFEPLLLMSASPAADGNSQEHVQIAWDYCEQLDGGVGNDRLIALVGDNVLNGGAGDDQLISARGDNVLNGGAGDDTAVYWADRDEFSVIRRSNGTLEISTDRRTDTLTDIEYVRFDDGLFSIAELLGIDHSHYRSVDGTGNNLNDFELGSSNDLLIRMTSPEYGDGFSTPAGADRPGAREVSNAVVAQETTEPNDRGLTDLVWLWGQFVDHDIDLSEPGYPHDSFNIPVPVGDPHFDPSGTGNVEIPMNRTIFDPTTGDSIDNPRQQVNQISAFIDGSMVYGSDAERADELRTFEGGQLATSDGDLLPLNKAHFPNHGDDVENLFLAGDVRVNENVALTAMHTLWLREHNRIAADLAEENPLLNDEQLFQMTREIVISEIQAITYNEFLPALLGSTAIDDYAGYDASIDPTIANEFSTAAYRIGHTLLSSGLLRLNNDGSPASEGSLDLKAAFFAPQEILDNGIDSLLRGVASKAASEVDTMIVDDVRNFLFGGPGHGGFDLASLNIQRGRDHGLADYNQVRTELGLAAVTEFADITSDTELQQKLEQLYGSVDNIDLWIGGLAEDHVDGSSVGETFQTILADQFTRLRDGDRFWYQNILESDLLQEVESTTLADVIERNTSIDTLQANVFFLDGSVIS
ncbi:peroxidase family protein [Fuerstiella marisgermanici]|uniref:Animal heme peroxidase n=1 Tax=Fuerstiella marisgermanici TaxID=1891926 RepID=A0A1P8WBP5_9PLAN|nr:peroxidase family protein [Fuerstiella marisgermanici]APZ91443.1 Animal heme peroxidase [Fuerstiella marisgermanici]